jgi:tetratricopeptide (TPR) repeat protein
MSLLLDALKEAEHHKRHRSGGVEPTRDAAPIGQGAATSSALSLAEEFSPQSATAPAPVSASAPLPAGASAVSAQRAEVIRLHAPPVASPPAGSSSRERWLVLALLAVAGVLGAAYFYLTQATDSAPVALAAPPLQSSLLSAAAADMAAAGEAAQTARAYVIPAPALISQATTPERRAPLPERAPVATPAPTLRPIMIIASTTASPLQSAYLALQEGDLARARALYDEALRAEPGLGDAHLGLAVIAQAQQDRQSALDHFRAVLRAVPDHPRAWAGMAELAGDGELGALESKLRGLLATHPEDSLHFALGNNLMRQSRWAEAQAQFFAATTAAPENPDYSFNLAVALDRIGKHAVAVVHYRKALQLATGRPAQFDITAARSRLTALAPEAL